MVVFAMNCHKNEVDKSAERDEKVPHQTDVNSTHDADDVNAGEETSSDDVQVKNFNAYMALLYQQFLSANLISNSLVYNGSGDSFNCSAFMHYLNKLALFANVSKNQPNNLLLPHSLLPGSQGTFSFSQKVPQIKTEPEILDLKCQISCSSLGESSPDKKPTDFMYADSSSRLSPTSSPEDLSMPKYSDANSSSDAISHAPSESLAMSSPSKQKKPRLSSFYERSPKVMSGIASQGLKLDSSLCSTHDIARMVAAELRHYGIPQAVFSQRVLGRSQGTLSDLLRNPKPWSKLKAGRETFRKMLDWLNLSEEDRLAVLRLHPPVDSTKTLSSPSSSISTSLTYPLNVGMKPAKKPRLVFTEIQRRTLLAIFQEVRHPSREVQATIAEQLGLKLSTVSNFFMNARRRSVDKYAAPDSTDEKQAVSSSSSALPHFSF